MNLVQMRQAARNKLDSSTVDTDGTWTDSELNEYINQGYQFYWQWLVRASYPSTLKEDTLDIVANTASIALPSDFFKAYTVELVIDDYTVPLVPYDRLTESNLTSGVAISNTRFTFRFVGSDILLEPTPSESQTAGIKLTYYFIPDDLSADTDIPLFSAIHHRMLVTYCVVQAKEKEEAIGGGGTDLEPFVRTLNQQEQLFKETIEPMSRGPYYTQPFNFY